MVTRTKKTASTTRRTPRKASKTTSRSKATLPEKLDLKRGDKVAREMIEKNLDWLKEMAKR